MSIFDGVSRPMRATGLGLLAVAVVAAAVGGVTLVSGGDDPGEPDNAAATSSEAPSPGDGDDSGDDSGGESSNPDEEDSGDSSRPDDGDGSGDGGQNGDDQGKNPGGDKPNDGSADDADGQDQAVVDVTVPVRIYNNSNVGGLAAKATDALKARGWNVVETGNYSGGVIPNSTVYFRPGTDEEAAARSLAEDFGMRVKPRFPGIADSGAGIIMIVTKDYAGPVDVK